MSKGNPNATKATPLNGKTVTTMPKALTMEVVKKYICAMIETLQKQSKAEADAKGKRFYHGVHTVYSGFNQAFERDLGFSPRELLQPARKDIGQVAGPLAEEFHAHYMKGGVKIYLPTDGPTANPSAKAMEASAITREMLKLAGITLPTL